MSGFLVGGWVGPKTVRKGPAGPLRVIVSLCGIGLEVRLGPGRLPLSQMRRDRNHVSASIEVTGVGKFLHILGHSGLLCASD